MGDIVMTKIDFLQYCKYHKKTVIKVTTGILILIAAFFLFIGNPDETETKNAEIQISGFHEECDSKDDKESNSSDSNQDSEAITKTSIFIDVSGAVKNPSVVEMKFGSRVFEAIEMAGGLTEDAETKETNLARVVSDGEKIYIPTEKEIQESGGFFPTGTSGSTGASGTESNPPQLININTASSETLQQLTGVGPSTAEKIICYRNEFGRFQSIEDLKNVSGIGEKTFQKLKSKITV